MNRFSGLRDALRFNGWFGSKAVPFLERTKAGVWFGEVAVSRFVLYRRFWP
jgi:hypothetical protein